MSKKMRNKRKTGRMAEKIRACEVILKEQQATIRKLKQMLKEAEDASMEIEKIFSAYMAFFTHKSGGNIEIDRKEISELINKYRYTYESNGKSIKVIEEELKKQ